MYIFQVTKPYSGLILTEGDAVPCVALLDIDFNFTNKLPFNNKIKFIIIQYLKNRI